MRNKIIIKIIKSSVIAILMIHTGIYGCVTASLWEKPPIKTEKLSSITDHQISVMVLDDGKIAILPKRNDSVEFNNLAIIYKFDTAKFDAIKDHIVKVDINENIDLSFTDKKIAHVNVNFWITMQDNKKIFLPHVDTTLTNRSDKEINFDDPRIEFHRQINGEIDPGRDLSWLWKTPLTPVTVAVDLVSTAAFVVVALPVLLVYSLNQTSH